MGVAAPVRETTPHWDKALEILADGQWHDRELLYVEMAKLVPPGRAIRHAELIRRTSQSGKAPAVRKQPRSTDFLITSGKRSIVRMALRGARLEFRTHDGRVQVRDKLAPHLES